LRNLLAALLALALFVVTAVAAEDELITCAYCDQPWDTRTRVVAVLADTVGAERYHFDSLWHYLEYLWHAEAEGSPYEVLLAGAEDYSSTTIQPSSWLALHAGFVGDGNTYVWTPDTFPGARKAPFVAAFARAADAEAFQRAHGGEVLTGSVVYQRMQERWQASHGPGGQEKTAKP
jgi:hypothetical protein